MRKAFDWAESKLFALYHALSKRPLYSFLFFFAFMVIVVIQSSAAGPGPHAASINLIAEYALVILLGTTFFHFAVKLALWVALRSVGYSAEDLRADS